MWRKLLSDAESFLVRNKNRRAWRRAVTGLACVVVFCTTYALILPAVTLESDQTLDCSYRVHSHAEDCYDNEQNLICGYADFVVHTHQDDACYDADSNLICTLEEIEPHEHDKSCYEEQSVLTCKQQDSIGHVHADDCYAWEQNLTCGLEEDAGHTHAKACYDETNALICGEEEREPHTHTVDCYERVQGELTCQLEEGADTHQHSEDCYETQKVRICGKPEVILHTHSEDCYNTDGDLICGLLQVEEHVHDADCITDNGIALMSADENTEIPTSVLAQLAKDYSIYPGTLNSDGTWTAINGADEEATVKATVTLPSGTTAANNSSYLYIREVTAEENAGYYPDKTTVQNEVGEVNDYQCYAIHWVNIYQDNSAELGNYIDGDDNVIGRVYADENGGHWVCIYATDSVLGNGKEAEIQIKYLNGACLDGMQAHRKLRIFNSRAANGQELEENAMATDVTATDSAYTGFTFTTERGGPYIFVSQTVFEGYVSNLTISEMIDGTEPFDSDNSRGNDSAKDNQIVRSYDVIQYNLTATLAARQVGVTRESATLYLEMTMDADLTQASFDVGQMLWMGSNYTIYYLDEDGEVLYWQDATAYSKRTYYYLGDSADSPTPTTVSEIEAGVSGTKSATLNAILSHSTNDIASYTSQVATQRLVGHAEMKAGSTSSDKNVLAAQETLSAAIQVLNAKNGTAFQPVFRAWLEGNEANYGSESGENGSVQLSPVVYENRKDSEPVTVSAAAKFNLELAKNRNVTYRGWFDSKKGVEVSEGSTEQYAIGGQTVTGADLYKLLEALAALPENAGKANPETFADKAGAYSSDLAGLLLSDYRDVFSNIRYGRITGYGLTLQVYNSATKSSDTAAKGFKGITLPQGDITFALNLAASIEKVDETAEVDGTQYYAQLWEYSENQNVKASYDYKYDDPNIGQVSITRNRKGNQGRNMYWADLDSTGYASWSATYNGLYVGNGDTVHSNYYGGTWRLNDTSGYEFTVSGYDFNFTSSGMIFPTIKAGNSGATAGYNTYIGCFSSGQIQVLNVFPRHQMATVNMSTTVTAKDLALTTTDGTEFEPFEDAVTGYEQETHTGDNEVKDDIPLYTPGSITKANAFCTRSFFDTPGTANLSSPAYFLGTYFWDTGYDCSAFAGQDITLVGAARINAGDCAIRSMNLLQLFDSEALSVDLEGNKQPYVVSTVTGAVKGETTILYAADPDHPNGYDTNDNAVLEYMSTVREEDLIYYTSLEELKNAGYTCVGVLAELRGWTINGEGGYSTVLKIPMTVSEKEKFVGKTVATVNTVRIWTNTEDMIGVSWKDGQYDTSTGKNSVAGYVSVGTGGPEHYSGQVANGSAYVKTEYENGQVKLGSNTGGYVYGSSLLILGYKAEVGIGVDKKAEQGSTYPTYNLDQGQYMVNYRLNGIIARPDSTGRPQETKTDLTVTARLDEPYTSASGYTSDKQRIAVSNGTYRMTTSANVKLYGTGEDGNQISLDSVEISDDPYSPTTVTYGLLDEHGNETGPYTIRVYAEPDTNGTKVVFHLSGVTVGASVPEITFGAEIKPTTVANNDSITSFAYVSGTSDVRAYSTVNGNMDNTTVGIIQLGATRLVKSVDTRYIELNGEITYTVTYTNSGSGALGTLYLNDLLPDNRDNRGSGYYGELELTGVNAYLSGKDFSAKVEFYYSITPYATLREAVNLGNSENRSVDKIEQVLNDYFNPLGTITSGSSEVKYSQTFENMTDAQKAEITGIYAVVTGLQGGNSINLVLETKALGNQAGDEYKNIAYSWIAGTDSGELTSNQVETTVLSRTISGVVWHDKNLDGLRNDGEPLLSDVVCTLFKYDDTSGQYQICPQNVIGENISAITTGADGTYCFDKLAAGDYIVAFSGNVLKQYTGLTTYQVTGGGEAVNSDAVAISELQASGIDTSNYVYAIRYSQDSAHVDLHTIKEIVGSNLALTNYVEQYAHLDCGVVITGPELPVTGGPGTGAYTLGGLALMAGAILWGMIRRKRETAC